MTSIVHDFPDIARRANLIEGRPQSVRPVGAEPAPTWYVGFKAQQHINWTHIGTREADPQARYNAIRSRIYAAPEKDGA